MQKGPASPLDHWENTILQDFCVNFTRSFRGYTERFVKLIVPTKNGPKSNLDDGPWDPLQFVCFLWVKS